MFLRLFCLIINHIMPTIAIVVLLCQEMFQHSGLLENFISLSWKGTEKSKMCFSRVERDKENDVIDCMLYWLLFESLRILHLYTWMTNIQIGSINLCYTRESMAWASNNWVYRFCVGRNRQTRFSMNSLHFYISKYVSRLIWTYCRYSGTCCNAKLWMISKVLEWIGLRFNWCTFRYARLLDIDHDFSIRFRRVLQIQAP